MSDIKNKSLAQIITNNHRAAGVFEKFHLDFCCKGKRTLAQACLENALNIGEVVAELENAELGKSEYAVINYDLLTLSQLTEYIVMTHHSYVKNEMPQILSYLNKVAFKHGERHPELMKVLGLFTAVKEEMELHMQKEEHVLFPGIKEMESQVNRGEEIRINHIYLGGPIQMMEQEHDHAGSMLAEIRKLTGQYQPPADACTTFKLSYAALETFEKDLHQHVHLENNILFPKALKLFGITDPFSNN